MRLTAFEPPPPTPSTLICAGFSTKVGLLRPRGFIVAISLLFRVELVHFIRQAITAAGSSQPFDDAVEHAWRGSGEITGSTSLRMPHNSSPTAVAYSGLLKSITELATPFGRPTRTGHCN